MTAGNGDKAVRRNAIRRGDLPAIAVLATAAGVGALFAGCHPTGVAGIDLLLTAGGAAFTVWLCASAAWWALAVAGGIAATFAGSPVGLVAAGVGIAIALAIGEGRRSLTAMRCLSAAVIVQVLFRLHATAFFGASALAAGAAFVLLAAISVRRRRPTVRRRIVLGAGITGGLALVATLAFGAAAMTARHDLKRGYDDVLAGLSQLQSGDVRVAARTLRGAAADLRSAADRVDNVWTQPAQLVPIVAQHRQALVTVVDRASGAADTAASALDAVDLDSLTIDQGVIDVDAVARLDSPLAALQSAVADLSLALDHADSPWLIGPARDRLAHYRSRAEQAAQQAKATAAAAHIGPAMLGGNGARRYLIAFCSPAEARGSGGVMGNYAVLSMDQGAISRTAFGRTTDLVDEAAARSDVPLNASSEFVARYGRYGLDASGAATKAMWSNATMTPDVPTAAHVLAQLWEGAGHEKVDGVFLIDPAGLAALLRATGPITVEGLPSPLDSSNLERFLFLDQYSLDTAQRRDLLAQVAQATIDALLGGHLPAPQILARDLGPAATSGHIVGWAKRPEEQAMLRLIGMDAALPALEGRDGLAVVTNNASANKIDTFLRRTVRYDATVHHGVVTATLTTTLHNTAPATGYPDYVIGSEFLHMPIGTNRTLLTVYSPLEFTAATIDDVDTGLTSDTELGWNAYTTQLDVAPGATRVVVVRLTGRLTADSYSLVLRPQTLANPDNVSIQVSGDTHVSYIGTPTRRTIVDAHGARALR